MATVHARRWAYFIVDKLGLPYAKSEIIEFVDTAGGQAAWNKFVASDMEYLEVARASHIEGPDDIGRFFRDASYSGMRATFPSKSHGRSIIGPHIVPLQKYREQKRETEIERNKYRVSFSEMKNMRDTIGKTVFHSADNGLAYGKGVVVSVNGERGTIVVEFEDGSRRTLRYKYCLDKGFIRFD